MASRQKNYLEVICMNSTNGKKMLDFEFETDKGVAEALMKAVNKAILLIGDVDTALVQHAHFNNCAIFEAQSILMEAISTLCNAHYSACQELGICPTVYELEPQCEDEKTLLKAMGLMRKADEQLSRAERVPFPAFADPDWDKITTQWQKGVGIPQMCEASIALRRAREKTAEAIRALRAKEKKASPARKAPEKKAVNA